MLVGKVSVFRIRNTIQLRAFGLATAFQNGIKLIGCTTSICNYTKRNYNDGLQSYFDAWMNDNKLLIISSRDFNSASSFIFSA